MDHLKIDCRKKSIYTISAMLLVFVQCLNLQINKKKC